VTSLRDAIRDAKARGYSGEDITVLSFSSPEVSAAHELSLQGMRLDPAGSTSKNITYASVSAFKGLENDVIILTDIDLSNGDLSRALFYTALTRSTGIVFVLCSLEQSEQLLRWAEEVKG
jgi:hypothetical protein